MVFEKKPDSSSRLVFECKTLELAYRGNSRNISAAPQGYYGMLLEYSPKFQTRLWELKGVPGRSEIKIHVANYYRQLNGCIAVGSRFTHIDGDGALDLADSANTLVRFHKAMEGVHDSTIKIVGQG